MKNLLILLVLVFAANTYGVTFSCMKPVLKEPLKNYALVGHGDTATISLAPSFIGTKLHYNIKAKPKNIQNKIQINSKAGTIKITAMKKDDFDVIIVVTNTCGKANGQFNVQIDEEP